MNAKKKIQNWIHKSATRVFLIMLAGLCIVTGLLLFTSRCYERYIRQELSSRTIAQLEKSEEEIYVVFQRMVNIANIICNDKDLQSALEEVPAQRYETTKTFDSIIHTIEVNNLYDMTDIRITLFDSRGTVYANWSTNYHNYDFLFHQDWVQESIQNGGYVRWNMFAPSYIIEEDGKTNYISLAKSLPSSEYGKPLGTLIVSLEQSWLSQSLRQFFCSPTDMVYICTEDGTAGLHIDEEQLLSEDTIRGLAEDTRNSGQGNRMVPAGGSTYLMAYYTLSRRFTFNGEVLKVFHFTNFDTVLQDLKGLSNRVAWVLVVCMMILAVLAYLSSKAVTRPIELLSQKMLEYTPEQTVTGLDLKRKDEVGQANRAFTQMSVTIRRLYQEQREETERRERYRFEALRAQVNPHFLFNTLNTIRWMAIIRKADNIVDCIDALATMMKYSMSRGGELVSLRDEVANIEAYIYINNCRYGNRFTFNCDVEEALMEMQVIKFILQPIVENAVIHGFKGSDKHGEILLYGDVEENILHLYVEDNGIGIQEENLKKLNDQDRHVTGIGVANVDQRIRSAYGEGYGLTLRRGEAGGTVAEYRLPVIQGEGRSRLAESDDRG